MAKILPSRFFVVPWSDTGSNQTGKVYDLFKLEKLHSASVSTAGGFTSANAAVVRPTDRKDRNYLWIERMEQDMPAFRYVEIKTPDGDTLTDRELDGVFAMRTSDRIALIDFAPLGKEYLRAIGDLSLIGAYIFVLEDKDARQICELLMKSDLLTSSNVKLGECSFRKPRFLTTRDSSLFGQFKELHPELAQQITKSVGRE